MSASPFDVWAIIRLLPGMQRVVVKRFRRRSDGEECLRVLRRATPEGDYILLYYPPGEETKFMVRKECNKLVRDRIPDILTSQNIQFAVEEMALIEYGQALRQRLMESAHKVALVADSSLIAELADLWEVIDAILKTHSIPRSQVLACQMQRRIDLGTFDQKLKLLWTEVI